MVRDLKGECDAFKAFIVYEMVKKYKPQRGLELGILNGKAYFPAAVAMTDNNEGLMMGLDPWCGEERDDWDDIKSSTLQRRDYLIEQFEIDISTHIEIFQTTSTNFHKKLRAPLDYLHIDGNNTYEGTKEDLENYLPQLNVGGLLLMSNLLWPQVFEAWEEQQLHWHYLNILSTPNWTFFLKKK